MKNAEFARTNERFLAACKKVTSLSRYEDFKPSTRQASKWRNQKGIAWKLSNRSYALK